MTSPTLRIHLGDFRVIDNSNGIIKIDLGRDVHITIFGIQPAVAIGTLVPLFTELPIASN